MVLLLGVYGAELFLSRVSLVILLAGLVLCFGGWQLLKELRFALLVLLLAIPIPAIIFNQITFPLQILASKLASALLPLFGVPVLREGNIIELPAMKLEVAEACSGIRSLMSLFTLSIFYGYFLEKSILRRAVLALASIPIAIAANAVRILRHGVVRPVLGSGQGRGLLSRVFRLGHVSRVPRVPFHRPPHHVLVPGPRGGEHEEPSLLDGCRAAGWNGAVAVLLAAIPI